MSANVSSFRPGTSASRVAAYRSLKSADVRFFLSPSSTMSRIMRVDIAMRLASSSELATGLGERLKKIDSKSAVARAPDSLRTSLPPPSRSERRAVETRSPSAYRRNST